jgi:N-acyl-D-amino-acid deacylase
MRRKRAMFDLIIQHARICDGTGNPSFVGTLGVTDGRITYLGRDTGLAARRTMNADGLVVAPGFIDPHTHYDTQIAWDPLLTSSPWHGVTTVVMGNCGVGVAPVKPAMRDILLLGRRRARSVSEVGTRDANYRREWTWLP